MLLQCVLESRRDGSWGAPRVQQAHLSVRWIQLGRECLGKANEVSEKKEM